MVHGQLEDFIVAAIVMMKVVSHKQHFCFKLNQLKSLQVKRITLATNLII